MLLELFLACTEPQDYLKANDPDADGLLGTSDSGTPDTYDCPDESSFLTEYYADTDGDGYYGLYNSSIDGFIADLCPADADALGYIYDDVIPNDEVDVDDTDANINIEKNFYPDNDGDGYGDSTAEAVVAYEAPDDTFVEDNTDDDDDDATIYPGAPELCDGKDNDQDGTIDDGFTRPKTTLHADIDNDGYGDTTGATTEACEDVVGYTTDATDCDDTNPDVNPAGTEVCNGIDDDCDTAVDSADSDITSDDTETWYRDADGDGFADVNAYNGTYTTSDYVVVQCDRPADDWIAASTITDMNGDGVVTDDDLDADDSEITVKPDNAWYPDEDGDGFGDETATAVLSNYAPTGYISDNTDWDDSDFSMNPDTVFYLDADGDGYGDSTDAGTSGFSYDPRTGLPGGYVTDNTDWDDSDFSMNPDTVFYLDADGDGYGDSTGTGTTGFSYDPRGSGEGSYTTDHTDFDDTNANSYPGAPEICDAEDNDNDGSTDEGLATTTYYEDADGDGDGDATTAVTVCDVSLSGLINPVTNGDDLNDADESLNTGTVFYLDNDGDGYGDPTTGTSGFTYDPSGSGAGSYTTNNTDFDDANANSYPGAPEICDGEDNDNDGSTDEGLATTTYYEDADGDGDGDATTAVAACDVSLSGLINPVTNGDDMNDGDATLNTSTVFYEDADGDGYGNPTAGTSGFTYDPSGAGYTRNNTDFDDANANSYPGAPEICDGEDNDDDGSTDEGLATTTYYADADGDGDGDAATSEAVCDVTFSTLSNPVTNSDDMDDSDEDLNTNTIFYTDADGDGHGDTADATGTSGFTSYPSGYALTNDDEYDNNANSYPGATVLVDGIDTNQDGVADAFEDTDGLIISGPSSSTSFPYSSGVGDLDGDGQDDICLSARATDTVYCTYGPITAAGTISSSGIGSASGFAITGTSGSYFGASMALGDFDDDGNVDLAVGANRDSTSYTYNGAFHNIPGPFTLSGSNTLASLTSATTYIGDIANRQVGNEIILAADINNDGFDDLLVSTNTLSSADDTAYIFMGSVSGLPSSPSTTIVPEHTTDGTYRIFPIGDLDGDGYQETAVAGLLYDSTDTNAGRIYVTDGTATGPSTDTLTSAAFTITGESASESLGYPLVSSDGCDLDGDGYPDLVYGSSNNDLGATDAGAVFVHLSTGTLPSTDLTPSVDSDISIYGENTSDRLGSLRSLCLVNPLGDGKDAAIVSARYFDSSLGRNYYFYDLTTGTYLASDAAIETWDGTTASGLFTSTMSSGDTDGDGKPNLIFGSYGAGNAAFIFNMETP